MQTPEEKRAYYQAYYRRNKALYVARSIEYLKKIKQLLRSAKDKPCADCGQRYPYYVMDFDHREGEIKLFNVSSLNGHRRTSRKKLLDEIAKCDVVCANCHRDRTHQRRQLARQAKNSVE